MAHIRRLLTTLVLHFGLIELLIFVCRVTSEVSCSPSWTRAGDFCYKIPSIQQMPNSTAAASAVCIRENGVFPVLRAIADFDAFVKYASGLNFTAPFRIPLSLRKSPSNEFYWIDSGEKLSLNESYWGEGQLSYGPIGVVSTTEHCVALSTLDSLKLHDYDCELPANAVCQRGLVDDSLTEVPCYDLNRCLFADGSHLTDTDPYACNISTTSATTRRQLGPSVKLGYASNQYHENVTEALYAFRTPATMTGSSSMILASNQTQIDYLTENGYALTKFVGFLPTSGATRGAQARYLYWKKRPPVDSALLSDMERKQYEAQGVWKLVDTLFVYGTRSENGKCSVAVDCEWSEWEPWSACSQTCDGGYRTRTRNLTLEAAYGGICPGNETEIDETPCSEICPRDCEWNAWTPWSPCSVTCDNGTWTRTRTVKEYSRGRGKNCSESDGFGSDSCFIIHCPIDCVWNNWTEWGPWPAECGPPVIRYRYRDILIEPKYKGKPCTPAGATVDSQIQALPPCPPPNDTYVDPVSPSWRVAIAAMQSLGSSAIISCSSISLLLSVAFRSFSIETVLHMGQEGSLIVAHTLITIFGFRGQAKGISDNACMPTSISLHYLFIAYFVFMVIEAIQAYSILTNVISEGGFMDRRTSIVAALISPLFVVLPTAMLCRDQYVSKNSCWLNVGDAAVGFFIVGPLSLSCAAVVILVEAVGVEDYYPPLPFFNLKKEQTATICRAGLMIKGPLAMISYIFGSLAVYSQTPWLYTCAMPVNICFGVTNIMFHVSANERVLAFVKERLLTRVKCLRRRRAAADHRDRVSHEQLLRMKRMRYQAAKQRRFAQKKHMEKQKVGAKVFLAEQHHAQRITL